MSDTALVPISQLRNMNEDDLKKQDPAALTALVVALKNEKLAVLGDSMFVRKDGDGYVEAVKASVALSEARKEIYAIRTKDKAEGKFTLTAQGYSQLNRIAGVNIVTPPYMLLPDGTRVHNPFIVMDKDPISGMMTKRGVWVQKTAIGLTPLGVLARRDARLYFDLDNYFLQDIFNKIQWTPENGEVKMASALTDADRKKLVLRWDYGIVIVADISKKDIRDVVSTQIQRQKFVERIATTICERRVLSSHPAIAAAAVFAQQSKGDYLAQMSVIGWRKRDLEKQVQEACESIERGEGVEIDDSNIIDVTSHDLDGAEVKEAAQEVETEHEAAKNENQNDQPTTDPADDHDPESLWPDEVNTVKKRITYLKDCYGDKAVDDLLAAIPVPFEEMTRGEKAKALDEIAKKLSGLEE